MMCQLPVRRAHRVRAQRRGVLRPRSIARGLEPKYVKDAPPESTVTQRKSYGYADHRSTCLCLTTHVDEPVSDTRLVRANGSRDLSRGAADEAMGMIVSGTSHEQGSCILVCTSPLFAAYVERRCDSMIGMYHQRRAYQCAQRGESTDMIGHFVESSPPGPGSIPRMTRCTLVG